MLVISLTLLAGGTAALAAASQLAVDSPDLSAFSQEPCTHGPLSVRVQPAGFGANRSAVQITNVPSGCFGNTFQVGVSNSSGTLLTSGSAVCSSANCVISTGSYNAPSVADAHVLAATWGVPATWDSACYYIIFFWYCL